MPHPNGSLARQRRPRSWLKYGLIGAALLTAAWLGLRAARTPKAPLVHYQTVAVDRGPILAKVTANGALSALVTVNVGSQVSGRVQTLRADFGSTVKQGDVVATIDPSMFQAAAAQATANHRATLAAVERAKAQQLNAEKQLARAQALHREGLMTSAELETAEASLAVARADLRLAVSNVSQAKAARDQSELNLRYTTIVSPIDGVVISRNVDVGQTVAATLQAPTLFTIAQDLTHMQVDTNVAEADVGKVSTGMDVTFTVDAYPGRTFHGRLRQVRDNAQTIQNVVTYDAVVDVDNGARLLKPGMTANVTFAYAHEADAVRVPNAALRFRPDAASVAEMTGGRPLPPTPPDRRLIWLLRSGKPVAVTLRPGISDGTFTALGDGDVHAGDLAIVETQSDAAKRSP
jgi:HlyD family secretion protein